MLEMKHDDENCEAKLYERVNFMIVSLGFFDVFPKPRLV